MNRALTLIGALVSLGWRSVERNLSYRLLKSIGYYRLSLPSGTRIEGNLFSIRDDYEILPEFATPQLKKKAERLLNGELCLFSHLWVDIDEVDWHLDVLNHVRFNSTMHFSQIGFTEGDVKCVWELSRFEWALVLARAYRSMGKSEYIDKLNALTDSWIESNPPYNGVNWCCGQETSIRLINVLLAWYVVEGKLTIGLVDFVATHLLRIEATIGYAISQDNNHGTSEAAALFIGGAWLASNATEGRLRQKAERFEKLGRYWLEERLARLVFEDGGFAQYSVNYHRVLLDTLNQVEWWRRYLQLPEFSNGYMDRYTLALDWLTSVVAGTEGECPLIGANDGARLYDMTDTAFTDFRPSVEFAERMVRNRSVYESPMASQSARWLQVYNDLKQERLNRSSEIFKDFGLVILRKGDVTVFVRFANFKFRPSQADVLHVEIFYKGQKIATDLGSYSYHSDEHEFYSSVNAHNTVAFSNCDQMPRLSKFLFGRWIDMIEVGEIEQVNDLVTWFGSYHDYQGNRHSRTVCVSSNTVQVEDEIDTCSAARIRWNLESSASMTSDTQVEGACWSLEVQGVSGGGIAPVGFSPRYLQKIPVSSFCADIDGEKVISTFRF